jgi:hypothetical protein
MLKFSRMNNRFVRYLVGALILIGFLIAFFFTASYLFKKTKISPYLTTPSAKKTASFLEEELDVKFTILEEAPKKISPKIKLILFPEKFVEVRNAQPIAVDALVLAVHPSNKITNLNQESLRKIIKGKVREWKELGGEKSKINLFLPHSDLDAFIKKNLGVKSLKNFSRWAGGKPKKNDLLLVTYSQLPKKVKLIGYNGIFPTRENIEQLQYPLSFKILLFGKEKEVKKVKEIIKNANFQRKAKKSGLMLYK